METVPTKKPIPAYLPYETFRSFIDTLHTTALPTVIDKSLMRNMSGGAQSHLMVALRFLGLIEDKGKVLPPLERLHAAFGSPEWAAELEKVFNSAYSSIMGVLSVDKATEKQLNDHFRQNTAVDGTMLDRAIRFYLTGLKDAKVTVSEHIGNRKRRPPVKRTNGKPAKTDAPNQNGTEKTTEKTVRELPTDEPPPPGMMRIPIYSPGKPVGAVIVHDDFDDDDCTMIHEILKAYAKRRAEKRQPGERATNPS
jgi:hypothetical protein